MNNKRVAYSFYVSTSLGFENADYGWDKKYMCKMMSYFS